MEEFYVSESRSKGKASDAITAFQSLMIIPFREISLGDVTTAFPGPGY